jgi:hypothetical protein
MHGMHGDLREEVDGTSEAWKRRLIDEFLGGRKKGGRKLKGQARESSKAGRLTKELKVVNVVAFVFRCI